MTQILVGTASLFLLSAPTVLEIEEAKARIAGRWTVKFENGVEQWCDFNGDRTASALESRRKSPGRLEVREGAVMVVYDEDRIERWTAVGRRAVVEHWYPAATFPKQTPVRGIAEPRHGVEPEAPRPDPDGRELKALVAAKTFAASLRKQFSHESAGELRKFIDPRYLKEHKLVEGAFPIDRVVSGAIYDTAIVDPQTVFMIVETAEAEREVWLFRLAEHKGEMYIVPPTPPDLGSHSFKAWTFRRKL